MTTPRDLATPLKRITWRDGQTLGSGDLRDDQLYVDRLRHLHIHYQHRTWGVVEGLDVIRIGSGVLVSPGYALDIQGRELLLPKIAGLPAPSNVQASTTMYLVVSWNNASNTGSGGCATTVDLATLCPGATNPIPIEQGLLSWKTVTKVRMGLDVLLARALVVGGKVTGVVDTSVQRRAVSMIEPQIWSDITQPGQTGWTDGTNTTLPEIQADVDTSDGGFIATPAYFARLAGTSQIAGGFVLSASPTGFTFVLRPFVSSGAKAPDAADAESAGWTIAWFAIELKG